jgi:aminoglycoside phosphotransferase (APT) family kinase protein
MHEFDEDDPVAAAYLFEKAAPDLEPPEMVRLEVVAPPHLRRWTVRNASGFWRLKLAAVPEARDELLLGARVTRLLRARGHPVPEVHATHRRLDRLDCSAVVERRLGTTDAMAAWRGLGPLHRGPLLTEAATALKRLHALREGDLVLEAPPPDTDDPTPASMGPLLMDLLDGPRAREELDAPLRDVLRTRIETGLAALPRPLERRLCHGSLGAFAVAMEGRAFAGLRDFEAVRWGDPWADVAAFLMTITEPGTPTACRIVEDYLDGAAPPPRLGERLDLFVGADLVRGLLWAPDCAPSCLLERLRAALSEWAHGPTPVPA